MNRLLLSLLIPAIAAVGLAGEAQAKAPRPPKRDHRSAPPAPAAAPRELRTVQSELMASVERSENDLTVQVKRAIVDWLAQDGVPASWTPPKGLVESMLVGKPAVEPVQWKDLQVFRASRQVDFSPSKKAELLEVFHRQQAGRRLAILGGGLVFVLSLLGAVAGYIRADEATRGYYTNPLRLVAAAGVLTAGAAVYGLLA